MKTFEAIESLDDQAGNTVRSYWRKGLEALFVRTHPDGVRVITVNINKAEQAQLLREAAAILESQE